MIAIRRRRGRLWFDLDDGDAEIEALNGGMVNIRISDHSAAAQLDTDDAVSLLRSMLREISGPSIDDVREVNGCGPDGAWCTYDDLDMCWAVEVRRGHGWSNIYEGATEREALQAAYDAGVERKGGET